MRGGDNKTGKLFSYVDLEARVRRDHPLREIQTIVSEALTMLERELSAKASDGRRRIVDMDIRLPSPTRRRVLQQR
jgi:hypothetical protein